MNDTPRTDVAQHNMGSIMEPHYVVDADFSRYLERELVGARAELAEAKEQLRLCNVDQFTTAAELAEAVAKERDAPNSTYQTVLAMAAKIRKGE